MRKVLFWLHLTCGITAGIVIVIMSVTGALLMYEKQITAWADGYRVASPEAAPVSVENLIDASAKYRGKAPTSLTVFADRTRAATAAFGREGMVFLDPYSGEILGEGSSSVRSFFRRVTEWHRWLALQGEERATGRAVTGFANLAFLFIVGSGLILWFPKTRSPRAFKGILAFRTGLKDKARDFNWHNVTGFWTALPLLFVVSTALPISFSWANDLLYRATGSEPPARPGRASVEPGARPVPPPVGGLDALWETAARHDADWRSITLRVPDSQNHPVAFSIDTSDGAIRPDKRSQIFLDRESGQVVRQEAYADLSGGRKLRSWARWIHTGEAFGLPGQTAAGLASFGVVLLAWTGFSLSWRRFRAWRALPKTGRSPESVVTAAPISQP